MPSNTMYKIGYVGLGVMGSAIASHVTRQSNDVFVYNRTESKTNTWHKANPRATVCQNLTDLAKNIDVVILCVGNDDDVRQVVKAMLPSLKTGSVIIDHTTTSSALAKEMFELCLTAGVQFLDCPVSGGQSGAENGTLTVMAGGDEQVFLKMQPILSMYSKSQEYFGLSGSGQGAKMVNQILIANILQGLSEGMTLAKKMKLDSSKIVDALQHGAAGSWQLKNRGVTMTRNEFNFGFAIDLMLKDLGIVFDCAKNLNLNLPATKEIRERYQTLSKAGFGREDTSALIRQYEPPK